MQNANCQQTGLNLVLITSAWGCFKTPYIMLFISPDIAIALSSMICINQESIFSSPFVKPYLQHSGFSLRVTGLDPDCNAKLVLPQFRRHNLGRPYSSTATQNPHLSWHNTNWLKKSYTLFKWLHNLSTA